MSVVNKQMVLHEIVQKIMRERNVKHYEFHIDGGTGNDDGYLGEIKFFHVIINGSEKLNLVFKSGKDHEVIKNILCADILYTREFNMYTIVIPELELFTKHKNLLGLDTFIPKLWFAKKHNNQVNIVLENLTQRNFQIWDRKIPMHRTHMEILFETYGRWHGISMAYRDQHPEKLSKLVGNWVDPRVKLLQKFGIVKLYKKELDIITNMLVEKGRLDLVNVFAGLENQIEEIVLRDNLKAEDYLIISHGDNWSNNYMFKYEHCNGKIEPNQVYFLDFQLSRPDSPALELSSTLYNMGDKNTFNSFNDLLNIYHRSLSRTLRALGSNPEKLFTMQDLKKHWKKHGLFSILNVFVYLRIALCESDEAPDLNKMAANGEDFDGAFSFKIENMELFWKRAFDVFVHYGEFCNQLENENK